MTGSHVSISVSISSNVPGYIDPYCIIEKGTKKLMVEMLTYMNNIQSVAQSHIEDKLAFVIEDLESQLHTWQVGKDEKHTFNKIMSDKIQAVFFQSLKFIVVRFLCSVLILLSTILI